jgi:hypothetical protein
VNEGGKEDKERFLFIGSCHDFRSDVRLCSIDSSTREVISLPKNLSSWDNLEDLVFENQFNCLLCWLPPRLVSLKLGHRFQRKLPELPETLQSLEMGKCYDADSLPPLPKGLKHLGLGWKYDRLIPDLPIGLQTLRAGAMFWRLFSEQLMQLSLSPRQDMKDPKCETVYLFTK